MTKNDLSWGELFKSHNILENIEKHGFFGISATQIRKLREPRIMCKFDHKLNLPKLFKDNNLSILPITRGNYIISHFKAYEQFKQINDDTCLNGSLPEYIESINYNEITTETAAINCAYASGILSDFTGENREDLLPTVGGRMGSGSFNFNINNTKTNQDVELDVCNSQIEIDAGFEGLNSLILVEAKNSLSDDFIIRQLYYPFRLWSRKIRKPVRNIFLSYSNGIFYLYEYLFPDQFNYNSIELVKAKKYAIEPPEIQIADIKNICINNKIEKEPEITFPQADKFERVINLCELLYEKETLTKEDITLNYDFDARQTNYYTDAARYLGLVEKIKEENLVKFKLSEYGQKIFTIDIRSRQLCFIKTILKYRVFNRTMQLYLEKGYLPTKEEIISIMKKSKLHKDYSDNTYDRRSLTVISWLIWIVKLID